MTNNTFHSLWHVALAAVYGASDWNFLLRFECDLKQGVPKKLDWKRFRHYSTVRDVMVEPERFGVPNLIVRGQLPSHQAKHGRDATPSR